MSGVPTDPAAAAAYLEQWMFTVLTPVGQAHLSAANCPFTPADFAAGGSIALKSLDANHAKWLSRVYEKQRHIVDVEQAFLARRAQENPSAAPPSGWIIDMPDHLSFDARTVPQNPLPVSSQLGDASVHLRLRYTITFEPAGEKQGTGGLGWGAD
jgi:hypothetical protein